MDLYETLGVERTAPPEVIRKAYRKAAKKAHPDTGGSKEKFAQVSTALRVLTDPEKRDQYDKTGKIEEPQVSTIEANALNLVMATVDAVMNTASQRGLDIANVDLKGDAIKNIMLKIDQILQRKESMVETAKKLRKVAARWSSKKGNRISPLLEARALDADRTALQCDDQKAIFDRAVAILKDHEFKFDMVQQTGGVWFNMSAV